MCTILLFDESGPILAVQKLKGRHTRGDKSLRLVPATSPGDQVPSCELPILVKNVVAGTKIWTLRLVPRIQTCLNLWDQSRGLVPQTMRGPFV